ncbi:MAG: hypothetical protein F4Z56_03885 [Candidatus Dadabacteria bacterium]|nr:hypothetical protein [Candidatus Dadabacteria bacterium]
MSANWSNRTIWTGDNLPIMRGMNSESVDLIYLDPPFNSKANYAAPIGSEAAGAEFKDTWTLQDVDIAWLDLIEAKHPLLNKVIHAAMSKSDKSYLIYMAVRLLEMHRILKPTGSIYLHCDPTMSHYLKLLMDAIFGRKQFKNEIVWCYTGPSNTKRYYPRKHDILLFYSAAEEWIFNVDAIRVPYKHLGIQHPKGSAKEGSGIGGFLNEETVVAYRAKGKIPEDFWMEADGFTPVGRIKNERVGYPTQKPLSLLERIIKASSNEEDVVFDPFCGCATTLVAADRLSRNWVGIDISNVAVRLVEDRIKADQGLFQDIQSRTDVPQRTDIGEILKYNDLRNKKLLYGEQGGHCNGCGKHFEPQNLEVDHIIAKKQGGTDHLDNLQLLCGYCNRVKGDRGQEYLIAKLAA